MNTETILEVFMKDEVTQQRILAVQRFLKGEKPGSICASLGKSKAWLYKWVERHLEGDDSWSESEPRRPLNLINRTPRSSNWYASISTKRTYSAVHRRSFGS